MNKRNKRILLVILGASVSTLFLVKTLAPAKADKEMVQVVQVKTAIHKAGDPILQNELGMQSIPKSQYQPGVVTRMSYSIGNYAATDLYEGKILSTESLLGLLREESHII